MVMNPAVSWPRSAGGSGGPAAPQKASRILAAAAVRPGDDLKQVAVGVLEIEAAPTIMVVNLALPCLSGVSPIGKVPFADAGE